MRGFRPESWRPRRCRTCFSASCCRWWTTWLSEGYPAPVLADRQEAGVSCATPGWMSCCATGCCWQPWRRPSSAVRRCYAMRWSGPSRGALLHTSVKCRDGCQLSAELATGRVVHDQLGQRPRGAGAPGRGRVDLLAGLGEDVQLQAERPTVFVLYEQNIGMLTPMIADELRDAERHFPADWIGGRIPGGGEGQQAELALRAAYPGALAR